MEETGFTDVAAVSAAAAVSEGLPAVSEGLPAVSEGLPAGWQQLTPLTQERLHRSFLCKIMPSGVFRISFMLVAQISEGMGTNVLRVFIQGSSQIQYSKNSYLKAKYATDNLYTHTHL